MTNNGVDTPGGGTGSEAAEPTPPVTGAPRDAAGGRHDGEPATPPEESVSAVSHEPGDATVPREHVGTDLPRVHPDGSAPGGHTDTGPAGEDRKSVV